MPVPQQLPHMIPVRGEMAMKSKLHLHAGNIVETMFIGNTTVQIADDFCAKTPEEIELVLEQFHAAGWAILETLAAKETDATKKAAADTAAKGNGIA